MKEKEFKFSIVMPIYNVEEYLENAINSVINQTIGFENNIQLILVNDGSPDNSDEICKKYKEKYPENIVYVIKENGGISSARNEGFKHAKGKYINFLDSDDMWDKNAFKKVYSFFEKHYEKIDVVACRINQFDAVERLHVLDYKFNDGDRVIDIKEPKNANKILLHVTSSFFKKEAIKNASFDAKVKYGEDSLLVNSIILNKCCYGILKSADYYYRKRIDGSSAIQTQKKDEEYYTVSPKAHYYGLIEKSKEYYSEILPYIQNVIAYDIGWRFTSGYPKNIKKNTALIAEYEKLLKELLNLIDEKIILNSRVHKNLRIKAEMLSLRNGNNFYEQTHYNKEENAIFYNNIRIMRLEKTKELFKIALVKIKKDTLFVEGNVSKWLFDCCPDVEKRVAFFIGKKEFELKLSSFKHTIDKTLYSKKERYYKFSVKIPLKKRLSKKPVLRIKAFMIFGNEKGRFKLSYGKFVPNRLTFEPCYKFFDNYLLFCGKKMLKITKLKHTKFKHVSCEFSCLNWLFKNNLSKIAFMRIKYYLFKKFRYRRKKIWLISDRMDKAKDNAEALFKFLRKDPCVKKDILPVFVISKKSPDVKRLKKIGKVIYFEDKKYINYFLSSKYVISSSGGEFTINPFKPEHRKYFTDLMTYKYVFLQHGIIFNDLSKWLQKFNKNIDLFITSTKSEYESVLNGDYYYTEKQVKLTGLARYDLLENNKEKQIIVIPTWRRSIKKSYDKKTRSVYYNKFKETEYFQFFNSLINNKRLLDCMKEYGYSGLFCLHPIHAKQYVDYEENETFKVAKGFVNYQDVLSKGSLLVTDYSSVALDFAYLKKPIIYSQFDSDRFFEGAIYAQGCFDLKNDGFGPVVYDLESTVDEIIKSIKNNCKTEEKYLARITDFYAFHDKNNCKRIYQEIIKI